MLFRPSKPPSLNGPPHKPFLFAIRVSSNFVLKDINFVPINLRIIPLIIRFKDILPDSWANERADVMTVKTFHVSMQQCTMFGQEENEQEKKQLIKQ